MNPLKQIIPLTVVMSILFGFNYLQAAWSGPPGSAPTCPGGTPGCEVPINAGSVTQTKTGGLNVSGSFSAGSAVFNGNSIFNRDIQIGNDSATSPENSPTIKFEDSDHQDWWIHINSNSVYFLADRNDDGGWSGENPWPLQLWAHPDPASYKSDWARFSGSVRADQFRSNEYCDFAGADCFVPADVAPAGNDPIGEGQQWYDMKTSRVHGTTYQNTTGRPIKACINSAGQDEKIQVSSNNSTWINVSQIGTAGQYSNGGCFVVPDTHYYRIAPGSWLGATPGVWAELR